MCRCLGFRFDPITLCSSYQANEFTVHSFVEVGDLAQFGRGSPHLHCRGPWPIRQIISFAAVECQQRSRGSPSGGPTQVEKNRFQARRFRIGRRALRPASESRIAFSTPWHDAIKTPPSRTRKSHHPLPGTSCNATGGASDARCGELSLLESVGKLILHTLSILDAALPETVADFLG
jgi:hypothetical protein